MNPSKQSSSAALRDAEQEYVKQIRELPELPRDSKGELDLNRMQEMTSEQSDLSPGVKAHLKQMLSILKSRPDVHTFDYQSLVVKPKSQWTLDLVYAGHVDSDGKLITVDYDVGNAIPGASARYSYRCRDDDEHALVTYRSSYMNTGKLEASTLVNFLRLTITHAMPPATEIVNGLNPSVAPQLPECLVLPSEITKFLSQSELRDFLDSLPAPFTWRIESTLERLERMLAHEAEKRDELGPILRSMNDLKKQGDDAFRRKDRTQAIEMYTKAIAVKGSEDYFMGDLAIYQDEERRKLSAICHANRAAAYLMPGEGLDPLWALLDGEEAEKLDPTYKKGYLRQARSYAMMHDLDKAKEVLNRALARKNLAKDPDVLEALATLQFDSLKLGA